MNFWISFTVILVIIFGSAGMMSAGKLRRKHLIATGDHTEGKVTHFVHQRNAINNSLQAEYLYHLTVEYKYQGVPMVSKTKMREDEMARFFPEIVRTKNLPDNTILPICVDPSKPKRIVPNITLLMREVYPEAFGLKSNKKDETTPEVDSENPNVNPYA